MNRLSMMARLTAFLCIAAAFAQGCASMPEQAQEWLDALDQTPDPAPAPTSQYDLTLTVTKLTRDKVYFSWTPKNYGWPVKTVKVDVDAVVHLYRANGKGGKFDWIRRGGQPMKGLDNVHSGYGGHTVPASGEPVTFQWVSVDGKKQSNKAEAIWP